MQLYALAFLYNDHRAMHERARWLESQPDYKSTEFALEAETEAYAGHMKRARELTRRAVEQAFQAGRKEDAAIEVRAKERF